MKTKLFSLFCLLCLLLSFAGCTNPSPAAPQTAAPELLAGTGYKLSVSTLGSGYQLLGSSCVSGETLFFLAEQELADSDLLLPDLTLFSVDAAGQVTVVLDYLPPAEEDENPEFVTHLGFFPDGEGGIWVAEAVTYTKETEEEEPVAVHETRLRRFSAAGALLGVRDVTDHISNFRAGAAVGDDVVVAENGKFCVFSPGSTISRPLSKAPYFLTPYDGSIGILSEAPTGLLSLSTMD